VQSQPDNVAYRLAARIAAVAGVFSLVVCALLLFDYSRRQAKDPQESMALKALKTALRQQPNNEALKEEIRAMDVALRETYARQRAFTAVGGLVLAGWRGRVPDCPRARPPRCDGNCPAPDCWRHLRT